MLKLGRRAVGVYVVALLVYVFLAPGWRVYRSGPYEDTICDSCLLDYAVEDARLDFQTRQQETYQSCLRENGAWAARMPYYAAVAAALVTASVSAVLSTVAVVRRASWSLVETPSQPSR